MPILLFVILFGLSMDYHVFIVSRIRERPAAASMDEAVEHGITPAGVVTSAAIVMVCVFAVFATPRCCSSSSSASGSRPRS